MAFQLWVEPEKRIVSAKEGDVNKELPALFIIQNDHGQCIVVERNRENGLEHTHVRGVSLPEALEVLARAIRHVTQLHPKVKYLMA